MANILDHILARRSIRRFTSEPVAREQLETLLRAAMAAPSASNRKPWQFVVVTEPERLAALRRGLVLGRIDGAAAIITCGDMRRAWPWPAREFWVQDCSAAMQNMWLTATGLGLGAVWVGVHPIPPFVRHVRRVLGLPRTLTPLGVLWVGHPAEFKAPRTQYDSNRVHWEAFDARRADLDASPITTDQEGA